MATSTHPPTLRDGTSMWYSDWRNVNLLLRALADTGYDAATLVYAHEKPWKFTAEYNQAVADLREEDTDA